jgi:hypothetical protein
MVRSRYTMWINYIGLNPAKNEHKRSIYMQKRILSTEILDGGIKEMDNLARYKYDIEVDEKVKQELQIANIPAFRLPDYMNTEVKTKYIGILNGFIFYRAWTYWVCKGDMPLNIAEEIYEKYKKLNIRAGGHIDNMPPGTQSYNPIYEKELRQYQKTVGLQEYLKTHNDIVNDDKTQPRFIDIYHIDTQLGLCKLADTIRSKNIVCEIKTE